MHYVIGIQLSMSHLRSTHLAASTVHDCECGYTICYMLNVGPMRKHYCMTNVEHFATQKSLSPTQISFFGNSPGDPTLY